MYEVARGMPLSGLVAQAGGLTVPVQAFLVGGYGGTWLTATSAWDARLSEVSLAARGGTLGAGVLFAFPKRECGVGETARILAYLAREGAGQCGPCANGLPAMARAMGQLARGVAGRDVVERLHCWAWQVTGRGACHHPDGAARMMVSALETFSAEVIRHRDHLPCPANSIRSYAGANVAQPLRPR